MALTEIPTIDFEDPLESSWGNTYLKDNINELIGRSARNLLVNGGFEVWQRGNGAFTADGYTADRWSLSEGGGSAGSVTRESSIVDSYGQYSLACVYTHNGTTSIFQRIEHWREMKGRTVCISMRIRQSAASMVRLFASDGLTTPIGDTTTTTGSFVTHTMTFAVSASATLLDIGVQLIGSGTVYLDNAMVVIGPAPTEYVPLTPQEELARCQRYYEVHGGVSGAMTFGGYGAAASGAFQFVPFAVPKGGVPTMTKNGTWNTTNCGQPSASGPMVSGYTLQVTVTALGAFLTNCNGTDDTITAEWNP